jgi:hypothetical protein
MQLKIKRSQRSGGVFGSKVIFTLDIRAEYAPEEKTNINKYNLGGEVIYNSEAAKGHLDRMGSQVDGSGMGLLKGVGSLMLAKMNLNVTIASLAKGHHIECKDLNELIEAENALCDACKNLRTFLDVAATFDGREVVIDLNDPKLAAA